MAPHGPDPALLAADNGDRLLLDHGLFEIEINFRRFGKIGAPFAERSFLAELLFDGLDFLGDLLPLLIVRLEKGVQSLLFFDQIAVLGADFHFLKFAQGAQTHVQNGFGLIVGELEALHQARA